jgi:hypothetical protein
MTTVCTSVARGMESMDLGHIKVAKPDFLRGRDDRLRARAADAVNGQRRRRQRQSRMQAGAKMNPARQAAVQRQWPLRIS